MKNITISGSADNGSNEVVLHEDLLVGIKRLLILTISDNNKLYKLPAKFFKSLSDLYDIDLSRNQFNSLDRDMFKYNYGLKFLNLSGNKFAVFENTQIFQQIKSLRILDLNHNLLKKFYYNATAQIFFNELQIRGNQLSYDGDITCPFSNILQRCQINLSSNQIVSAVAVIDCFDKIKELTEMNLENNAINQIELKPLMKNRVGRLSKLLLANNNITCIDILDEVDSYTFSGEYEKPNLIVDLDLNPLFCENCDLLKQMLNLSFSKITSDVGTIIELEHPHKCKLSVFCDEQIFYDHDYMCPETCSCRYNEFTQMILIDCVNKGLTKFPLIDYSQLISVEYFILNFKDNKLTEFTTSGQNPEVFKRLKSINLENNAIETFNLSLLYNKVDEILLQNNRLRITKDFINHFNDREILLPKLKMTLSGNNYCDNFNTTTNLFNAINFDLIDEDFIKCMSNSTEESTTRASSSRNTGHSKLWVIPVFLLFMALICGYVYYRSHVGNTTARFINRLRYRKANVESESNRIHDES